MHKEIKDILKNYEEFLKKKNLFFLDNIFVFNHYSKIFTTSNYNYKKYLSREDLLNKLTYFSKEDIIKIVENYFYDTYKIEMAENIINYHDNNKGNNRCHYETGKCSIDIFLNYNLQDVTIITHEYRHYLNMNTNNYNYLLDNFTESLSTFEELNVINYLEKNFKEYIEEITLIKNQIFNKINDLSIDYINFFDCFKKYKRNNKLDFYKIKN